MEMSRKGFVCGAAALIICAARPLVAAVADEDARIDALLAQMTLEEKIGQLWQTNGKPSQAIEAEDLSKDRSGDRFLADVRAGRYGSLIGRRGADGYNLLQRTAMEGRLGIPLLIGHDLIHSARTCFPIPLALSCSWEPELWRRIGEAIAVEALTLGCNWTFTPMSDISPDARWGRIAEGPGQDPYLASLLVPAMVKGLQGDDPADGRHIAACAKHYIGYGASTGGLDYYAVEMADGTLRDVYLPPFRAAVDAGVATVMPAFHSFNGVPCSMNRYLLTDILRGELGFDGLTISDYRAVDEMATGHGVAERGADVAAKALNAGMDMEMISDNYEKGLKAALASGRVKIETVDNAVRNILRVKFRFGLFDHPTVDVAALERTIDFPAHLALSREAARKSAVLLKNGGVLPLRPGLKVALVGDVADSVREMRGCWEHGDMSNITNTTLLAGLRADGVDVTYSSCYKLDGALDEAALRAAAADADVVVAAFGEYWGRSGENRSVTRIELAPVQLKVLETLKRAGRPVVAVVFGGRPLALPELDREANAVLMAWNPGGAGGWGVADVLTGLAEPYGRLTVDFPNATGECPKVYNRMTTGRPSEPAGARWSTHYMDIPFTSVYPFGWGLTYTTFDYAGERVHADGDDMVFSVDVKNTGDRAGSEVVQVYVRDVVAATVRPRRELKGYARVWIEPGETKTVQIRVPKARLGYWVDGSYRVEAGEFKAWIAPHSDGGRELTFRRTEKEM